MSKYLWLLVFLVFWPGAAWAMHLADGVLSPSWAGLWFVLVLPFWLRGLSVLRRHHNIPYFRPLVGILGAALFVISCLPVPVPLTGTCAHPCGAGLAAIFLGPSLTVVISSISLLFQALFLAHGGLSTLGANTFSFGVAGAFVGYGVYRLGLRLGLPLVVAAFLAGLLSDWFAYSTAAVQIALAVKGDSTFWHMFSVIILYFVPTQVPLGILEGIITAGACLFVQKRRPELLNIFARRKVER